MASLNQFRAFTLAADLGSFTAAAEALGIAQASASELVRRLEDEYHAPLFLRSGRRLTVTVAAEALMPHARRAVVAADEADRALRSLRSLEGGTATFGVPRNADYYRLSHLVRTFHTRYPAVRVRLVGQNSAETAAAIARGEIEAGLVVLPVDDAELSLRPLVRDRVLLATVSPPADASVGIAEFARRKLILYDAHYGWTDPTRRQLRERAQMAGIDLEPLIEVERAEAALELAAAGIGDTVISAAVASSSVFPSALATVPFAVPLYDTIAIATRRGRPLSPATKEFSRLAEDSIRTLVDPASGTVRPDESTVPVIEHGPR